MAYLYNMELKGAISFDFYLKRRLYRISQCVRLNILFGNSEVNTQWILLILDVKNLY